jgi:asparagine synthase (glutamine-hydrolysing)
MCGIVGIFRPSLPEVANREFVDAAMDTMVHRGPDGRGALVDGPVAIGMTRLAIIDVAGSSQPLFNETGDLALVCNGEIYNYCELREELLDRGHRFRTNGDCETILHLYEDFGWEGVSRLRGMFAFALWDRRKQLLLVGRDRLGIKPLYWVARDGAHLFCSAQRALVSTGLASPSLADETVLGYLRYGFAIDQEQSLLADVRRVPPGCLVEVSHSGSSVLRYWSEPQPSNHGDLDSVFEQLEVAARIHQRADVETAVLLSSGVDSSLVAALAVQDGHRPRVFTAGYRSSVSQDESHLAEDLAGKLGLSAERLAIGDDDLWHGFEEMSSRVDEPAADASSVVQWLLYRHARKRGCRVVYTGIGGDEVFLGYPTWNRVSEILAASFSLPRGLRRIGPVLRALIFAHFPPLCEDEGLLGVQPANLARARILSRLMDRRPRGLASVDSVHLWTGLHDTYRTLRRTFLVHNGLLLADKLGMAASVEVRVPLVDHVVLEAMLALPLSLQRPQRGFAKPVLRAALERAGVSAWTTRVKKGFEIPPALVTQMVRAHFDEIRESSTARAIFSPARWRGLTDAFAATGQDASQPSLVRDRLHRRAWILSLASRPDAWSLSTFFFSILCLDRCRKYWSSPATEGLAALA